MLRGDGFLGRETCVAREGDQCLGIENELRIAFRAESRTRDDRLGFRKRRERPDHDACRPEQAIDADGSYPSRCLDYDRRPDLAFPRASWLSTQRRSQVEEGNDGIVA